MKGYENDISQERMKKLTTEKDIQYHVLFNKNPPYLNVVVSARFLDHGIDSTILASHPACPVSLLIRLFSFNYTSQQSLTFF
jgi:hypothetical protein